MYVDEDDDTNVFDEVDDPAENEGEHDVIHYE